MRVQSLCPQHQGRPGDIVSTITGPAVVTTSGRSPDCCVHNMVPVTCGHKEDPAREACGHKLLEGWDLWR